MSRTTTLIGLVLGLSAAVLGAGSAKASTFTGTGGSWATSTKLSVPMPSVATIDIQIAPCPELKTVSNVEGCLVDSTVYVTQRDKFSLAHELGHLFDTHNLSRPEREYLRGVIGPRNKAWGDCGDLAAMEAGDYGDCAKELFADAYAACALRLRPDRFDPYKGWVLGNWEVRYGWEPTPEKNTRACHLIRTYRDAV